MSYRLLEKDEIIKPSDEVSFDGSAWVRPISSVGRTVGSFIKRLKIKVRRKQKAAAKQRTTSEGCH